VIHRSRATDASNALCGGALVSAVVDVLVALAGLALLFVGALLMFLSHPNALAYLLVGGLLLVADAGVTTRLRVARLERQLDDAP
jgi:hypothetical protein